MIPQKNSSKPDIAAKQERFTGPSANSDVRTTGVAEINWPRDFRDFDKSRWDVVAPAFRRPIKRALEFAIAAVGFLVLLPMFALLWLLVRVSSKGPGLYWSQRLGRHGVAFWMPKFRTMTVTAPTIPREQMVDASSHITPIGHLLRSTSLDESPQLWSVLTGDMSLIGPRPLLPTDPGIRARWDFREAMYVRPGLTGLAQVRGRNLVLPRLKARYDAFYAKRGAFSLDLYIVWRTLVVIVTRKGLV